MNTTVRGYLVPILVLLAVAAIFAADLLTPLGVAVWLAYLGLMLVVGWNGRTELVYGLAVAATLLMAVGYLLSPPGVTPWVAAVNRTAGALALWLAALLLVQRRRLFLQVTSQAHELALANETLRAQAEELEVQAEELRLTNELLQSQAEELRIANDTLQTQAEELEVQAEELRVANDTLQTQAEELEVQAEELQTQNDGLAALTEQLDRRVQERTAELQRSNRALQAMSRRMLQVQENERRALSRELHDESAQLLTSLTIGLGLLERASAGGAPLAPKIADLKRTAVQLAEGLHRIAVDLRPLALDRSGLLAAAEQYVESYRLTCGIPVDLLTKGWDDGRLPGEIETALYRVLQEALTNIARHAHATRASVLLTRRPESILAVVEDDGDGFDVAAAEASGRLGLAGMRERAELLGGTLTLESRPGAGTSVFVEIPWDGGNRET